MREFLGSISVLLNAYCICFPPPLQYENLLFQRITLSYLAIELQEQLSLPA